jgi:fucose permease
MAQLVFGLASFIGPKMYSYLVTSADAGTTGPSSISGFLTSLVPSDMSWVSVYWVFGIISMLMIVLVIFTKFPRVELKEDEKAGTKDSYFDLFKNKYVILFFLGIFAYVGTEQGVSYWMSKFLSVYHGYDYETVGANAVANYWGLMTIGGVLGLILLKIFDSKQVLRWFTTASILGLIIALFGGKTMSLYAFPIIGFFMSVMYPIIISLALNSVSKHHGSFAGILMTGIMGGAVVQLLIGAIGDLISLKVGMLFNFVTLGYIFSIGIWAKPLVKNATIKSLKDIFK